MNRDNNKEKIMLSVGILVSNRKQYIRKAMEALKPLLEAVPSELIVVDTKGEETDGSIDIVREYTDKIYPFTWCNDFAAARNVCIDHARGEWFMFQDDDEWFDDVQELIDFFKSGECEKYNSACYYSKNYDIMGSSFFAIAGRVVRKRKSTRFVGKVHERYNEFFGPCKQFKCFVHHMGYAYFTPEEEKEHQNRNMTLLKKELQEDGYTPIVCMQIVQELFSMEDTAKEALEFAYKSMEEFKKQKLTLNAVIQWILVAIVRYHTVYSEYDIVKIQVENIRKEYELSQMAELVIASVMIGVAKNNKQLDDVVKIVDCYIEHWNWLQAHPEEALSQTVLDFPRYYSKECLYEILYEGARAENLKGNYKNANVYWNKMPWKEEEFDGRPYYAELQITKDGYKRLLEEKRQEKIYEEITELYSVLYEAESFVKQLLSEERKGEAIELLISMQEIVIVLGNKREELLKERIEKNSILERCCELLWQCANEEQKEKAIYFIEEFFYLLHEVKKDDEDYIKR